MNDPLVSMAYDIAPMLYSITTVVYSITTVEVAHGHVPVGLPMRASACNWRLSIFLDKADKEASQS